MKTRKRQRRPLLILAIVLILIAETLVVGIGSSNNYFKVNEVTWHEASVEPLEFINFKKPHIYAQNITADDLGCEEDYSFIHCEKSQNPLMRLNCEGIYRVDPLLGDLTPAYPIAICDRSKIQNVPVVDYLYKPSCWNSYIAYIIKDDGRYRLISTDLQLRTIFAPIESKEEALAYAIARTGYEARFGQYLTQRKYEYYVDFIEDTHVEETSSGYRVNLFQYYYCFCAQHDTFEIVLNISRAGHVTEISKERVYRDKARICIN